MREKLKRINRRVNPNLQKFDFVIIVGCKKTGVEISV